MSYFDKLLRSKNITWRKGSHLWSLRLNDNEYYELKEVLKEGAKYREFLSLQREATLYYAEWWRREFDGGHASIYDVCFSLLGHTGLSESLYEAAKKGAENQLGIQIIRTQGEIRERGNFRYSIFYQGGLPMNYIIKEIMQKSHSPWDRFFRQLVWNLQDYTEIPGIVAPQSNSIKDFCETLRNAADCLNPLIQPYSHNEVWWNIIIRNFEEEKRKRKARTPFESTWLFGFDEIEKKINLGFKFTGPQTLSSEFITEHHLQTRSFTTFSVLVNDTPVFTAEYNDRFYCRRNVEKNIKYNQGEIITVKINETGTVLSSRDIDFDVPKLVYLIDKGKNTYRLGDAQALKEEDCRIIAAEHWNCDCKYETFTVGGKAVKVFYPEKGISIIHLYTQDTNESKTFDSTKGAIKTFIDFRYASKLQVPTKEITFNTENTLLFYEGTSETEINRQRPAPVLYAEKGSRAWIARPKLGEIRAKVRRSDNESIECVRFINTGNLCIKPCSSSRDECKIHIGWEYGTVSSTDALEVGDSWVIKRKDLEDSRYARFSFKPNPGLGSEFTLTILPPFYGFSIYDRDNQELRPNSIIPLIDLNEFRYYLKLPESLEIYPNKAGGDIFYAYSENGSSSGNNVYEFLCNIRQRAGGVAYEGRLASLFMEGSEQINRMINRSCESLPNAEARIIIRGNGIHTYRFKAFPYRLKYEPGVVIIKNTRELPRYDDDLLAIPIDCPEREPITLQQNAELLNCYILPEEILNSEHSRWLIYGKLRGYVLPYAIDTKGSLTKEERDDFRVSKLTQLKEELLSAPIKSAIWERAVNWYKRLPLGRIPGTSILELVAIADDKTLLNKFALQLWLDAIERNESLETLQASLIEFSEQMSFIWGWSGNDNMLDYADDLFNGDESKFVRFYYTWALSLPDENANKQNYLTNPEYRNPRIFLEGFQIWLDELKTKDRPQETLEHPDVNTNGDGLVTAEARSFFESFSRSIKNIQSLTPNERWIAERKKISELLEGPINLGHIADSEEIKREIRKSIISGLRYKISE